MEENGAAKIVALVAMLEEQESLTWDEVFDCVADYPGWVRVVEMLNTPQPTPYLRNVPMGSTEQYSHIVPQMRERLLEIFHPYGLLLDTTRTPAERALALHAAGFNVLVFCKENASNGSTEIAGEAKAVLAACQAKKNLLRGAAKPSTSPKELVRPAVSGGGATDALLHPADSSSTPEPRPSFFRRLFGKRE